ncbi:CP2 transcription factor, putative [Talaromyces stipitatus ATCC 10500]|uniref:CP2 transcription factor, putative n=1 Tax=Talaromyces stipitatus (strain ATCC 10500 / CBS 375.48 / QM 6759 / NRRL 1006) TaxID=441959 RepID=B8M5M5_TALSN|nr:CP2 transcription factor, putative [Talaromyces stipitatus ATCC 10500]EED19919.1 CP2 transcription factor, putative [Talaromyces stipitatus ATCC 10500]
MFRNRRTSQKPDEELISKFKKTFPDVNSTGSLSGDSRHGSINPAAVEGGLPVQPDEDEIKANDPTPRNLQDLRFTPSLMDPNSFQFMALANQPPGYYTPTPGGMTTIYHHQAGDLHTPLGYNLVTPISIPNTLSAGFPAGPNGELHVNHFPAQQPQFMPQNYNPFAQQTTFAPPSAFVHRDSIYDPMDGSEASSSLDQLTVPSAQSLNMMMPSVGFADQMEVNSETDGEKFRFGVALRAPTAMVKHADEIPVTYLNKGQAYSVSVVDNSPPPPGTQLRKYRTFIRVSFEDEQQRSKPATCWQLWKEGRGSSEAHQRGGKLLAVEYVDPNQNTDVDQNQCHVELEKASFDGFCVTWTANSASASADCSISVRFNFLSTDFSHSKGVKGIPVRFCAKTEILSPNDPTSTTPDLPISEVAYCKVKLFRDHGAERKLSNDVAHVKKTMEKLKQQMAQLEMGGGNFGKRKRNNVNVSIRESDNTRPVKVPKHKRTWSMESQENGGKLSPEDDLQLKYTMMQDMFSSTRPVSVLSLRGDDQDDPDLFPVVLPGDLQEFKFERLSRQSTRESLYSNDAASGVSNILSPTTSSFSNANSPRRPSHTLMSQEEGMEWANPNLINQPVKVKKGTTGYIEAIDIDPTYRPPAERPPKPIACFYIRFPDEQNGDYYRAVYLTERTVRDLMTKISEKYKIDPDRIVRVLRVSRDGLKIMVDDDVVQQLPEGQDMVAEITEASKLEVTTPDINTPPTAAVEVKLTY